ncbi:MAG: hypothetical protein LC643_05335 [Bacteroidales bacterium]|nr:hypothetical protein [Bacteroidales bacterium]
MKTRLICLLALALVTLGVTAQQITSVSPASVERGINLDITITASDVDFSQGTSMVKLSQGSTEINCYDTRAEGSNTLKANFSIAASVPTGLYDLTLTINALTFPLSSYHALTITAGENSPELSSLSVKEGFQGEELAITVTASNTRFTGGSSTVSLVNNLSRKTVTAQAITTNNDEELEAVFKFSYANDIGLYSLKLFNELDGLLELQDAFTLKAGNTPPAIISLSPKTVRQGETLDIEITTTSMDLSQGTNLIQLFNENSIIKSNSYTLLDANTLNANFSFNIDYPIGVYDLLFKQASGIELNHPEAITLEAATTNPALASSTPNDAKQGEEVSITIYGVNTHFNQNQVKNKIYLHHNGISINPIKVEVIDNTTISALFDLHYGHPEGAYTLFLYNAYDGTHWLPDAFNVLTGDNTPKITSVSPNVLMLGTTLDVEITGENIDFSQGTNLVKLTRDFTTIIMNSTETVSPNVVTANFTISYGHPTGDYLLSIINDSFDANIITDKTLIKRDAFFLKSASTAIIDVSSDKSHVWINSDEQQLCTSERFETIQLYGMQRQLLLETQNSNSLNMASLPPGYYLIKLWKNKVFTTEKIVISE